MNNVPAAEFLHFFTAKHLTHGLTAAPPTLKTPREPWVQDFSLRKFSDRERDFIHATLAQLTREIMKLVMAASDGGGFHEGELIASVETPLWELDRYSAPDICAEFRRLLNRRGYTAVAEYKKVTERTVRVTVTASARVPN